MSGTMGSVDRQILPRWRTAHESAKLGELAPAAISPAVAPAVIQELKTKEATWNRHGDIWAASEFVTASLMALQPDRSIRAAAFLVEADTKPVLANIGARALSALAEQGQQAEQLSLYPGMVRQEVAFLKRRLALDPRNAMAWADLALGYAVLGQSRKAQWAMETALRIAPSNRFLLRSAARLFVHQDDAERAHRLLVGPARSGNDPWLMAAELAVAAVAGREPRSRRVARSAIEGERFAPRELTEAASALATSELGAGSARKARKLFRNALRDPNENSLAQAEWATSQLPGLVAEDRLEQEPTAYEARAHVYYDTGEFTSAVREARAWLMDEPFAEEPATFGSCVAEMGLRDYPLAIEFATLGLNANPHNATLVNNLAYALIEHGELEKAGATLRQISAPPLSDSIGVTWRATEGLLSYRRGDAEQGRREYQEAIDTSHRLGLQERQAMATMMLAREEWRIHKAQALPLVYAAVQGAGGYTDALLVLVGRLLEDEIAKTIAGPTAADQSGANSSN